MAQDKSALNSGIQANTINAGAVAVGTNAQANNYQAAPLDRDALAAAIAELKTAIAQSAIPERGKSSLQDEVGQLEAETSKDKPDADRLKAGVERVGGIVKSIVDVVGDAAGIVEPLTKLAGLAGVVLALF